MSLTSGVKTGYSALVVYTLSVKMILIFGINSDKVCICAENQRVSRPALFLRYRRRYPSFTRLSPENQLRPERSEYYKRPI